MSEIKSTLDLVMERTRHLSLSAEEKARQQAEAFDRRLQGLLQQYADGALLVGTLQDRIAALQTELAVTDRHAIVAGVVGRIDPDRSNRPWLDLMGATDPTLCEALEAALADFAMRKRDRLQAMESRLRQRFAERNGIRGTAVVPNPEKDDACRADLAALRQQVRGRLEALVNQTIPSDQT